MLEFAATVDPEVGRRLLTEHRIPIDVLRAALAEAEVALRAAVAAVCATLPVATDQDVRRAERLAKPDRPRNRLGCNPLT